MTELYDEIGVGYGRYRRPDPRIAAAIAGALGPAEPVLNVGAGAGSYEPTDRAVVAVEPSRAMIRQRRPGSARVVRASASALPFRDGAFAAALAVLTIHHWPDRAGGLAEVARITRDRFVIVTWDPAASSRFWLVDEYFPEIWETDRPIFPSMDDLRGALGDIETHPLAIPHDCIDGFLGAYWRRPHAYLDAGVRGAISTFAKIGDPEPGLTRLRRDLDDGTWRRRHEALMSRSELDLGYRLAIARPQGRAHAGTGRDFAGARIERVRDLPLDALGPLVAESEHAGSRFVRRLVDEWVAGVNRFERPGETFFGAWVKGRLVGVCGLNVDPYGDDERLGRVRHLYVLSAFRRLGVGRLLVTEVVARARGSFETLRLRTTNPAAARLYEALGFRPAGGSVGDATHVMTLPGRPLTEPRGRT